MQLESIKVDDSIAINNIKILEKKCVEHQCRIEQAEKLCKELVIFEPKDLPALRDQFALTTITHRWKPVYLSKETQVWAYDDAVQLCIAMKNNRFHCRSEVYAAPESRSTSLIKCVQTKDTLENLALINFDRLTNFSKQFEKGNSICSSNEELGLVFKLIGVSKVYVSMGSAKILATGQQTLWRIYQLNG